MSSAIQQMVAHVVQVAETQHEPERIAEALESEIRASGLTARDLALTFSTLETALHGYLNAYERPPGTVACSFCHKSQGHVALIVQGPSASICCECVAIAADVVKERRGKAGRGALRKLSAWFRPGI